MKILPLFLFTSLFLFSCEQGSEPETLGAEL